MIENQQTSGFQIETAHGMKQYNKNSPLILSVTYFCCEFRDCLWSERASANVGGGVEFSGSKSGRPPVAPSATNKYSKNFSN